MTTASIPLSPGHAGVPPQISKARAFLWGAATVAAPLAFYLVLSSVYIGTWYAQTHHQGPPPPGLILHAVFATYPVAIWAVVILWWFIYRRQETFVSLYSLKTQNPVADIAIGVAMGVAWVLWYAWGDVVAFPDMFRLGLLKLASVPLSISAGFCEEALFRGFLFLIIARAGGGRIAQVAWSALAFGMVHVLWGPWGMFWTVLLGLTFAVVTAWRRTLWPALIAHVILDLCIEPGLFHKALAGGFNR